MKKYIISFLCGGLLLTSCSDWLDVNTDPNTPSDVPADMIFPSAEASIATRIGGKLFNSAGFFAQYWGQAPEANQYNELEQNSIPNTFVDNDYREIYAGALYDLERVRSLSAESNNTGGYLAATVLRAFALQTMVDMIDKVPYTEALQGSANTQPKWDEGADVYDGLLKEIDEALANYDGIAIFPSSDLIFSGSASQWIGFANALKLRLMMRASFATDKYNAQIVDLINKNTFFKGDVKLAVFVDESGKRNPWYETNTIGLTATNNIATYDIIKTMEAYSDPRLAVVWAKNATDEYAGNYPGAKSRSGIKTNQFSTPIMTAKTPVYLYTQSELLFFISEAKLRFANDKAEAKAAYEEAIAAGLAIHGLELPKDIFSTSAYAWKSTGTTEENLEQIGIAKWIGLCMVNHFESWNEIRRLGYPKAVATSDQAMSDPTAYTAGQLLYPTGNILGAKALLNRLPYPNTARIMNANTPAQPGSLTETVWWDKK